MGTIDKKNSGVLSDIKIFRWNQMTIFDIIKEKKKKLNNVRQEQ